MPAQAANIYSSSNGQPVSDPHAYERIGSNGPLLLQDFHLIDALAHFDRERIPERVVHAKGQGAHGEFVVTHDISKYTCADLFSSIGKKTPVFTRFSTVGGENGSADTARDPRGFAVKFKTDEGNWDFVGNNTPVFFLRDPSKFPNFIHTQKRNPRTHLKDANMFWDYLSQNPESMHQVCILFSDRGTPDGVRQMHGYSGHTFKFVNKNGEFHYVKIHLRTEKVKTLDNASAGKLAGENPDYSTQDLSEAIDKGNFPEWTMYIQAMTPEQAESYKWNIFDLTKVWPHKDFPLIEVGKMVLNKNPENYFAETEQSAFSPSHLVPGIEPSADPVLQSRLFSYPDTHRHRLGTNYQQIPINKPNVDVHNFQRDGAMVTNGNQGSAPNYPSTFQPLQYSAPVKGSAAQYLPKHEKWVGQATFFIHQFDEKVDFEQPRNLINLWDAKGKAAFVSNVSGHLSGADKHIQQRQVEWFKKCHPEVGGQIAQALGL